MFEVRMCSEGGCDRLFYAADTIEEAQSVGASYGWYFVDENGFEWELYLGEVE